MLVLVLVSREGRDVVLEALKTGVGLAANLG